MAEFDLELTGDDVLQAELERLGQKVDTTKKWKVFMNTEQAEHAIYQEFGTRHHPPYPYFRPAIKQFKAGLRQSVLKTIGRDLDDARTARQAVDWVADAFVAQVSLNATAQVAGGRSPGTHPAHPKVRTGQLRSALTAVEIG